MTKSFTAKYKNVFDNSPAALLELDYRPLQELSDSIRRGADPRQFILSRPALVTKTFSAIKVLNANAAALDLCGVKDREQLTLCLRAVFLSAARDFFIEQFVELLAGARTFSGEFRHRFPRKGLLDIFWSLTVPPQAKKDYGRVVVAMQDISAWKKTERQLLRAAQHDALTHLLNQGAVIERLENELLRARRYGLTVSCMMVDLDFFKVINDKFGHQRGDQILRRVSRMINNCFRKVDIVGRYGGDEFLIILPETKPQNANYAAIRLQKIFADTVFKYKRLISFHITLSIGITGYPAHDVKNAKELISLADKAMYSCKMAGRNRIAIV